MSKQDCLDFHLMGDSLEVEHVYHTVNGAKEFFWNAINFIENREAWTMDDFETAREKLCELYPSPEDIWDAADKSTGVELSPRQGNAQLVRGQRILLASISAIARIVAN